MEFSPYSERRLLIAATVIAVLLHVAILWDQYHANDGFFDGLVQSRYQMRIHIAAQKPVIAQPVSR